jgi:hypothetical protein
MAPMSQKEFDRLFSMPDPPLFMYVKFNCFLTSLYLVFQMDKQLVQIAIVQEYQLLVRIDVVDVIQYLNIK